MVTEKNTALKILWISRHPMTEEQSAALGDVEITQWAETLTSPEELGDVLEYTAVAAVYPLERLQELIDYCKPIPVLRARTRREFNKDGSKKEFVFDGWERVLKVQVETRSLEDEWKARCELRDYPLDLADDDDVLSWVPHFSEEEMERWEQYRENHFDIPEIALDNKISMLQQLQDIELLEEQKLLLSDWISQLEAERYDLYLEELTQGWYRDVMGC